MCDCPYCCSCCCPSVALQTPYFQDHQLPQPIGMAPQSGYSYSNHTQVHIHQPQPYYYDAPTYPQQQQLQQQQPYSGTNEVTSSKLIEINIYQA